MARRTWTGRVVLITGASSGIGRACADLLARTGFSVYGASRSGGEGRTVHGWTALRMDVRDDISVANAVGQVLAAAGRLDAVINNAGVGIAGSVEDTTVAEAKDLFETNFFGALRVTRAALPHLRAAGGGTIVNVSSIGGRIALPFQGLYSASKFALEGLTEALRMELRPFGIRVVLVEPGDTRTPFTAHRRVATVSAAYADRFVRALARAEKDEEGGTDPEAVARVVLRILRHRDPRLRYTVGKPSQRLAVLARRMLPGRLVEWGIMRYYRVLESEGVER